MAALGYHVTYFDLDTEDYLNESPSKIAVPMQNFMGNLSSKVPSQGDWLVIGHDIHEQTAVTLTEYMLVTIKAQGYRAVTVGECLGDPAGNWYRSANGAGMYTSTPTPSPSASAAVPSGISVNGDCGRSSGRTCLGSSFGNCCSANGWW